MKQMTTEYIARTIERLEDVACDIRIAMRDCCRVFGCILRRHKCNCAWIKLRFVEGVVASEGAKNPLQAHK
ncbi:MAG: hypothetical protein CL920_09405 [Deltaproteobacteria bacterium]|nr:hypothetical protein [Deltaproteobacteria bacterium]